MEKFLQLTVGGLAVGGIYAVAALGFVIIFKSTRVINFAQGAMMALGGYVGFAAITLLSLPLPIAIAVSAVVTAAVVGLIYVSTIAPVAARGNSTEFAQVIITMGWSIVLLSLIELMFGPLVKSMPRIFPTGTFSVGTIRIPYQDVGTISVAAVIITVFAVIFTWTRFGLVLRGLSDNRQAAVALGANAVRVGFGAWALGGAAAALAGLTLTSYVPLSLTFGEIALLAFPAVVLGGIDSIPGALFGGVVIGLVQQYASGYVDTGFGTVAGFMVMLIVLLVRPNGLLGSKEVVRL